MNSRRDAIILAGVTVFAAVFPLMVPNKYYLSVMIFLALNAAMATALNLFAGYAGQVSLGHAAFFGMGAYASSVLTVKMGWHPIWAALVGAAGTGAVAYLVAIPTLKLKGHYLAMATLGLGIIVQIVINEWETVTGGACGMTGIPPLSLFGVTVSDERAGFWVSWAFLLAVLAAVRTLVRSRVGLILRAIHHNERFVYACGVDAAHFKNATFVVSAVVACAAGSLYAHAVRFVSPETFGFGFSVFLVTAIVVGGMATRWGGLVGAALLTLLPEVLRFAKDYDVVVYGALLMSAVLFMPRGIVRTVGLE